MIGYLYNPVVCLSVTLCGSQGRCSTLYYREPKSCTSVFLLLLLEKTGHVPIGSDILLQDVSFSNKTHHKSESKNAVRSAITATAQLHYVPDIEAISLQSVETTLT